VTVAVQVAQRLSEPGAPLGVGGAVRHGPDRRRPLREQDVRARPGRGVRGVAQHHLGALQTGDVPRLRCRCRGDGVRRRHARQRGVRDVVRAGVHQRGMDLVGEHPAPVSLDDVGHCQQLVALEHPPGRVVRVHQDQQVAAGGRAALGLDGIDRAFRAGGHLPVLVNPHNPTGRVLERDELLAVADVVERNGGRVFSDEIHAPLVHPGAHHIPYASLSDATAAHTVTATSASKAWNIPGLKCAQVVLSNAADAAAWARADILLTEGASTIGAVANSAAYTEAGPWLAEALGYLDRNRHALRQALDERAPLVGYRAPEGTYLAWLDLRAALDARPGTSQADDDAPGWALADPGDLSLIH